MCHFRTRFFTVKSFIVSVLIQNQKWTNEHCGVLSLSLFMFFIQTYMHMWHTHTLTNTYYRIMQWQDNTLWMRPLLLSTPPPVPVPRPSFQFTSSELQWDPTWLCGFFTSTLFFIRDSFEQLQKFSVHCSHWEKESWPIGSWLVGIVKIGFF